MLGAIGPMATATLGPVWDPSGTRLGPLWAPCGWSQVVSPVVLLLKNGGDPSLSITWDGPKSLRLILDLWTFGTTSRARHYKTRASHEIGRGTPDRALSLVTKEPGGAIEQLSNPGGFQNMATSQKIQQMTGSVARIFLTTSPSLTVLSRQRLPLKGIWRVRVQNYDDLVSLDYLSSYACTCN